MIQKQLNSFSVSKSGLSGNLLALSIFIVISKWCVWYAMNAGFIEPSLLVVTKMSNSIHKGPGGIFISGVNWFSWL